MDLSFCRTIISHDERFIESAVSKFIVGLPNFFEKMEKSLEHKDWTSMGLLANKLKSSSIIFGITQLTLHLTSLEEFARDKQHLEQIPRIYPKIKSILLQARGELLEEIYRGNKNG